MHFYQRNIGDFARDTASLSALEVGVYDLLLDSYYATEQPLPLSTIDLRTLARTRNANSRRALEKVLTRFFVKTAHGYLHHRVEEEIEKVKAKSSKARKSAEARWEAKKRDANASEDGVAKEAQADANASQKSASGMRSHSDGNATQDSNTKTLKPKVLSEVNGPLRASARRKSLASLLTANGVTCSAAHSQVIAWALDEAVSDEVIDAALTIMRQRKVRDPKPQYLKPIIEDLIAQQDHGGPLRVITGNARKLTPVQQREADQRAVIAGVYGTGTGKGDVIDVQTTELDDERTKRLKNS